MKTYFIAYCFRLCVSSREPFFIDSDWNLFLRVEGLYPIWLRLLKVDKLQMNSSKLDPCKATFMGL